MKPSVSSPIKESIAANQYAEEEALTAEDIKDIKDAQKAEAEALDKGYVSWNKIKADLGLNK